MGRQYHEIMIKPELQRRQSFTERVFAYFRARPGEWVSTLELEREGGRQAWRTRVSDVRKLLDKQDLGTIENETLHHPSGVVSRYRYVPYVRLGPDAAEPRERSLF